MRPNIPNATYWGDIRRTIHNREVISLYGVLGRAWPVTLFDDPNLHGRWFFQPAIGDTSDANTYIVYRDSLEFS